MIIVETQDVLKLVEILAMLRGVKKDFDVLASESTSLRIFRGYVSLR